jgi:hypothetical protein
MSFPQPPLDVVPSESWERFLLFACATILGLLGLYALREWTTKRDPVMLVCLVAGMVTSLVEVPFDTLLQVYFPEGQTFVWRTFGRGFPLWTLFCYPIMFGVAPYLVYRALRAGRTRRELWLFIGAGFAVDCLLEFPILHMGHVYLYYGNQPFQVFDFPMYWCILNVGAGVIEAALIWQARAWFRGARWLLLIPLFPSVQFGFLTFVAWPLIFTMNTGVGLWATTLAGAYLVIAGLAVMAVIESRVRRNCAPPVTEFGGTSQVVAN